MTEPVKPGQLFEVRDDGRWNIFLDASMCSALGNCPQYFKYLYVDSIRPKGDRVFVRDLGSWWSSVMEDIYSAMLKGIHYRPEELVQVALKHWVSIGMSDLAAFAPKTYKSFGGEHGAIQMICEYGERQLLLDYANWKIIAAEPSFGRNREVKIGETDKIVLYWMGQPDLTILSQGRLMPVDHKSAQYINTETQKKYKPHIQLPGYIIALQELCKTLQYDYVVDRCIVNLVARSDSREDKETKEKKRPRFIRVPVSYTEDELVEWRVKRLSQAELLRRCLETNEWPWNEHACQSMWFRPCMFRDVDSQTPKVRPILLEANFTKVEPWVPGRKTKTEESESESLS